MSDPLLSTIWWLKDTTPFKISVILRSPLDAILNSLMLQTSPMNRTVTALLLVIFAFVVRLKQCVNGGSTSEKNPADMVAGKGNVPGPRRAAQFSRTSPSRCYAAIRYWW